MKLSVKHLVSLKDLNKKDFELIFKTTTKIKKIQKSGKIYEPLKNKTLAMIFEKPSTRTRASFEVGMSQLGGHAIFLSPKDIQLGRGESVEDTAKVLSRYLEGIMARTFKHETVLELAKNSSSPIINGLTDFNHPCQILADLHTVLEHKGKIKGLKFAWVGDGNNVCHSFIHAAQVLGFELSVSTPKGYEPKVKGGYKFTYNPKQAVKNADVIITDTWVSMGDEKNKKERLKAFKGFIVNSKLCSLAKKNFVFMHCLPAYRGYEVSGDIIDGKHSIVLDEAENRLHTQKAVMVLLMK